MGKIVYDDSPGGSGKIVFDGAVSDKIVFADTRKFVLTSSDTPYWKDGSDADKATAISGMKAAAWTEPGSWSPATFGASPYIYLLAGTWYSRAVCIKFDMQPLGVVGDTISKVSFNVFQHLGGTGRVGVLTESTGTPDNDWTWLTGATSTTVTATGAHDLSVSLTLDRWLWMFLSVDTDTDGDNFLITGASDKRLHE
jgi:hypothetical protein